MVEHVPQVIDTDYYNAGVFAPLLLPNRRTFAILAAFTMSESRSGWKALLQVSPFHQAAGAGAGLLACWNVGSEELPFTMMCHCYCVCSCHSYGWALQPLISMQVSDLPVPACSAAARHQR